MKTGGLIRQESSTQQNIELGLMKTKTRSSYSKTM